MGRHFFLANRRYWQHIGAFTFDCSVVTHSVTGNTYQKGYYSFDFSYKRMFLNNALSIQNRIDDISIPYIKGLQTLFQFLKFHFYTERQYKKSMVQIGV